MEGHDSKYGRICEEKSTPEDVPIAVEHGKFRFRNKPYASDATTIARQSRVASLVRSMTASARGRRIAQRNR
jgi:hypothetical protein